MSPAALFVVLVVVCQQMTVAQLREECKQRNLPFAGLKAVLGTHLISACFCVGLVPPRFVFVAASIRVRGA